MVAKNGARRKRSLVPKEIQIAYKQRGNNRKQGNCSCGVGSFAGQGLKGRRGDEGVRRSRSRFRFDLTLTQIPDSRPPPKSFSYLK